MFHSNVDMLDAYTRGTGAYVPGGKNAFPLDMSRPIGAGFQINGGAFVYTDEAYIIFRNGSPYTFFPNIKP